MRGALCRAGRNLQLFALLRRLGHTQRLPDPEQQYYYVNQGPTYTGPGNWAPRPVYQEDRSTAIARASATIAATRRVIIVRQRVLRRYY